MESRKKWLARIVVIAVSFVCIMYGISRGEVQIVFNKAVNICLECIGLG